MGAGVGGGSATVGGGAATGGITGPEAAPAVVDLLQRIGVLAK